MRATRLIILFGVLLFGANAAGLKAHAQSPSKSQFQHLTIDDGIAGTSVIAVAIDARGFLWMGTSSGVSRYDGTRVSNYYYSAEDSTSIPSPRSDFIYSSRTGDVWVGTQNGLALYRPETDNFERVRFDTADRVVVTEIIEEKDGSLLLSTWMQGLLRYHPTTKEVESVLPGQLSVFSGPLEGSTTFRKLYIDDSGQAWASSYVGVWQVDLEKQSASLPAWPNESLSTMARLSVADMITHSGKMWMASYNGLFSFDLKTGKQTQYFSATRWSEWSEFYEVFVDSKNRLWVGSNAGVALFDETTNEFKVEVNNPDDELSLAEGSVYEIIEDHAGGMWFASDENGVSYLDIYQQQVSRFQFDSSNSPSIPNGHVWSAATTKDGRLWLGVESGFGKWNFRTEKFEYLRPSNLSPGGVSSLHVDHRDQLWIGTQNGQVCRYNPSLNLCTLYGNLGTTIYTISEGPGGTLWFSSFGRISRLNPGTGQWISYDPAKGTQNDGKNIYISTIAFDQTGTQWLATGEAFEKIDSISPFVSERIAELYVSKIYHRPDGKMWLVGTEISEFDPETQVLSSIKLPENQTASGSTHQAVMSKDGTLWVSLRNAIATVSMKRDVASHFTGLKGRKSFEFSVSAGTELSDGTLVMGFEDEMYMFNPNALQANPFHPLTQIINADLDGKTVSLSNSDTLTVTYSTRVLRIDFSAPHYSSTTNNSFEIWLEGFEDDWRPVTEASVSFTNLEADTYLLHVRTIASNGLTDESPAEITIIARPPWWATFWFAAIMAVSGGMILFSLYRWRVEDMVRQNRRLDKLVEDRTIEIALKVEELRQANELKSRFFSNISHELKTPLTLIRGYLEDLSEDEKAELAPRQKQRVSRAKGLTGRLDSLVTQLLDLARADGKSLKLKAEETDLCAFVHRIVSHFSVAARKNFVDLTFEQQSESIWFYFDPIKMDQVVSNLIGNALKFTPKDGSVWVSVEVDKDMAVLTVADTGPGISQPDQKRIFERFFQAGAELTRDHEGLGIGLSLSKDFVELHHGTISVASGLGEGSVFTVKLPIPADQKQISSSVRSQADYHDLHEYDPAAQNDKKHLLLVEDNRELRHHIAEVLEDLFEVTQAADGAEAWKLLSKSVPDIVLTDVMMPGMSGLDLLREIRLSPKMEQLPVVLLTARSGIEAQVEALEAKADDFVAKPFNRRALRARLVNLVRRETEWKAAAEQHKDDLLPEVAKFLKEVKKHVLLDIASTESSVAQLAEFANVSERTFQRKIKDGTGLTAAAYIKTIKLERAKELLEEGLVRSVTQAAFETGFGNVSYFSKVFEETYGMNPKTYML